VTGPFGEGPAPGEEDHLRRLLGRDALVSSSWEIHPRHLGHHQVGEDGVKRSPETMRARASLPLVSVTTLMKPSDASGERPSQRDLVIDDQDPSPSNGGCSPLVRARVGDRTKPRAAGRATRNTVPLPTIALDRDLPPRSVTISVARATTPGPFPAPRALVVRKGSKMRSRSLFGVCRCPCRDSLEDHADRVYRSPGRDAKSHLAGRDPRHGLGRVHQDEFRTT